MIYCVEDERNIRELLIYTLETTGFKARGFGNGNELMKALKEEIPELILLDIMLPEVNGFELMEYIREYHTPVIFITARSRLEDKVKGLGLGADDYITRPFALAELIARVECVLRRYHKGQEKLLFRDLEIDAVSRVVRRNGENIELTMKELDLLLLFLRNRNITLFRDRIYEEVWEGEYDGESRTVDLHVQRLKKKLGLHTSIISVRKIGYRLED